MNPRKASQPKAHNLIHEALAGTNVALCSGLGGKPAKAGIIDDATLAQMRANVDGAIQGKAFLGRTLRQFNGVDSIGHRVARAAGLVVDDNGKLRCPAGTPNANQFTDLNMTGCMDFTPSGDPEELLKQAASRAMQAARDAGIASRTQRVAEEFGDLATIDQQKAALRQAFPNADVDLQERLLDRISPFGRRQVQEARRAFVTSLLAESMDFPEVAENVGIIHDRLSGGRDSDAKASTLVNITSDGFSFEIGMSQLGVVDPNREQGWLATDADEFNNGAFWHAAGSHEFGHAVDFTNVLSHMGIDTSSGKLDKVRPHKTNSDFDERFKIASDALDVALKGDDEKAITSALEDFKAVFNPEFQRGVDTGFRDFADASEVDDILEAAGGKYARKDYDRTKSLAEAKAELFARSRVAGHDKEVSTLDESGIIKKTSRDMLREMLGVDVPSHSEAGSDQKITRLDLVRDLREAFDDDADKVAGWLAESHRRIEAEERQAFGEYVQRSVASGELPAAQVQAVNEAFEATLPEKIFDRQLDEAKSQKLIRDTPSSGWQGDWRRPNQAKPQARKRDVAKPKKTRRVLSDERFVTFAGMHDGKSSEEISQKIRAKNEQILSALREAGGFFRASEVTRQERQDLIEGLGMGISYSVKNTEVEMANFRLDRIRSEIDERIQAAQNAIDLYPDNSEGMVVLRDDLKRQKEYLESKTNEELMQEMVSLLREVSQDPDTRIGCQIPNEFFETFIETGGAYKTTHDDSVSSRHSQPVVRMPYETLIGVPRDAPASLRPASGYMMYGARRRKAKADAIERGQQDEEISDIYNHEIDREFHVYEMGGAQMYGGVQLIMRPEVNERSKFGQGDSFNQTMDAAPVVDPTDTELLAQIFNETGGKGGTAFATYNVDELISVLATGATTALGGGRHRWRATEQAEDLPVHTYHEALIFGSFDLTDVEEIRIPAELASAEMQLYNDRDAMKEPLQDPKIADIVNPDDVELFRQYEQRNWIALTREMANARVTVTMKNLVSMRKRREMVERIRAVNDDITIRWQLDGVDLDMHLADLAKEAGAESIEEFYYEAFKERWNTLIARLRSGEVPLDREPIDPDLIRLSHPQNNIQQKVAATEAVQGTYFPIATNVESALFLVLDSTKNDAVVVTPDGIFNTTMAAIFTRPTDYVSVGTKLANFVMSGQPDKWSKVFVEDEPIDASLFEGAGITIDLPDWFKGNSQMFDLLGVPVNKIDSDVNSADDNMSVVESKVLESVERFITHDITDIKVGSYTKPELRSRLKRQIMAGGKGGKPGQWSARKAQMLAQEYERQGGGYKGSPRKSQRSLKKWTSEEWTTSDGEPAIRDGGTNRYLPKKAWAKLTPAERSATNRKKRAGSKRGEQFVPNTRKARRAGAKVRRVVVKADVNHNIDQTVLGVESKNLRRMVGRAVNTPNLRKPNSRRSWVPLTERDGDGDGFRVNPLTGRDEIPVEAVSSQGSSDADDAWRDMMRDLGIDAASTGRDARRRKPEFDPDDLGLMPRERRATPDPWDGMRSTVPSIEPTGEDPFDAPRTRVRIDSVSIAGYTQLENIVAAKKIAELIKKHNLEHRERSRIAKLQRVLFNLKPQSGSNALYLDLNAELVKRLYKGMQTLQQLGELDGVDGGDAFYKAIKNLYRGGLPAEDAKSAFAVMDTKAFSFGRRAGRGVRRLIDRPNWDGDGDGFITNPLNGRDEIPWNRAEETAEEAVERFMSQTPGGGRRQRRLDQIVPTIGGDKRRPDLTEVRKPDVAERTSGAARSASGTARPTSKRKLRTLAKKPSAATVNSQGFKVPNRSEPSLPKPPTLNIPEMRWREFPLQTQQLLTSEIESGAPADQIGWFVNAAMSRYRPPRKSSTKIVEEAKQELLQDSKIKDRVGEGIKPKESLDAVVAELTNIYGDLRTRNDFKNAFPKALNGMNAKVKIKDVSLVDPDYGGDDDQLTDSELGALLGHLWMAHKYPEIFRDSRVSIKRKDRYSDGMRLRSGAHTGSESPYREDTLELYDTFKAEIVHDLQNPTDPLTGATQRMDSVFSQMEKTFLLSETDGMSDDEIASTLMNLHSFWMAVHETVHMAHFRAAGKDLRKSLDNSQSSFSDSVLETMSNPEKFKAHVNSVAFALASDMLAEDMKKIADTGAIAKQISTLTRAFDAAEPEVERLLQIPPHLLTDENKETIQAYITLGEQIQSLQSLYGVYAGRAQQIYDSLDPVIQNAISYGEYSGRNASETIAKIAFEHEKELQQYAIAKLANDIGIQQEDLFDPAIMLGPMNQTEVYDLIGSPLSVAPQSEWDRFEDPDFDFDDPANQQLIDDISAYNERFRLEMELADLRNAFAFASKNMKVNPFLRDDLTDEEWKQLSSIWKYVSSYAKDKHSHYGGQFGLPLSLEGVAEAVSLALVGGSIDPKNKVNGDLLIGRLAAWLGII